MAGCIFASVEKIKISEKVLNLLWKKIPVGDDTRELWAQSTEGRKVLQAVCSPTSGSSSLSGHWTVGDYRRRDSTIPREPCRKRSTPVKKIASVRHIVGQRRTRNSAVSAADGYQNRWRRRWKVWATLGLLPAGRSEPTAGASGLGWLRMGAVFYRTRCEPGQQFCHLAVIPD